VSLLQRMVVYLTFPLLLWINFHAFSSMAILYKGMNHFLPPTDVEVYATDPDSTQFAVPVRRQHGYAEPAAHQRASTGQAVEVLVHNSFYDRLRMLPFWNMGVLMLACVAYLMGEAIKAWRARGAP